MSPLAVQLFYTKRDHFGAFAGIQRLIPHLDRTFLDIRVRPVTVGDADLTRRFPLGSQKVRTALEWWVQRGGRPWYYLSDLAAEAAVIHPWLSGKVDLLHYLDGEHTAQFLPKLGRLLRLRGRSIATFHQPLSVLPDVVPAPLVRSLDHVTLMSSSQRAYFTKLMPEERISVLHHGVDTAFFAPRQLPRAPGPFRCLTTGSYLRDWSLLRAVAEVSFWREEIQFHVVSAEAPHFEGLRNVVVHRGVSDSALRSHYQSADLLVLPLHDATANNALLEGMACGLPVVASDLPAVREYAPGQAAALVAHHPDAFVAAIAQLAGDDAKRAAMARAARTSAESSAWQLVARRYENLYERVIGLRSTA